MSILNFNDSDARNLKGFAQTAKADIINGVRFEKDSLEFKQGNTKIKAEKNATIKPLSFGIPHQYLMDALKAHGYLADEFGTIDYNTCGNRCKSCKSFCYNNKSLRAKGFTVNMVSNLLKAIRSDFEAILTTAIELQVAKVESKRSKYTSINVRIHESGDFFSDEYMLAWLNVMKKFPQVKFYTYTKQFELVEKYRSQIVALDNFSLQMSLNDDMIDDEPQLAKYLNDKDFNAFYSSLEYRYLDKAENATRNCSGANCLDCRQCIDKQTVKFVTKCDLH